MYFVRNNEEIHLSFKNSKSFKNERNSPVEDRLVLNLTYHSLLRDFQKVLNEAQILLTPNEGTQNCLWGEASHDWLT